MVGAIESCDASSLDAPAAGAADMPQLCPLAEETADHGPLDVGTRMLLAHHRPLGRDHLRGRACTPTSAARRR